jgi:murein DD-endopeptidase MepM/ murein hydrolase activator NlpD
MVLDPPSSVNVVKLDAVTGLVIRIDVSISTLMRRTAKTVLTLTACALALAWHAPGHAAPPAPPSSALTSESLRGATQSVRRYKLDRRGRPAYLARFSDGPRRVPEARGAAKVRADRLGIGTGDAARKLLAKKPSDKLLREVGTTKPKELLWPVVRGNFGRGFGMTRRLRPNLPHNGIDIGAPAGTVVRAAADGLVVYSDNGLKGYGNCVMILHPGGLVTLYAHNQQTTVQAGRMVKRGERIALVGQTGYAWGPHLHFELRDNGRPRDPMRRMVGQRSEEVNGQLAQFDGERERPIERERPSRFAARRGLAPR